MNCLLGAISMRFKPIAYRLPNMRSLLRKKDVLMVEKDTKNLSLEGELIDKVEKLQKVDTYCFEKEQSGKHFE